MTIDKKLDDNSFRNFSEEPSLRVIYVSDAKQIIHEALKKQREILIEDKSFELAQDNYVEDGVDYREDMSMIDLAHDSFAHGYFYAIKRLLNAPEPEL